MDKKMIKEIKEMNISKSEMIRKMYGLGMSLSDISKEVNVRYNFVYNVISRECMINNEVVRVDRNKGKVKSKVIELLKNGLSLKEICEKEKINYNYCWSIRKEWELKNK